MRLQLLEILTFVSTQILPIFTILGGKLTFQYTSIAAHLDRLVWFILTLGLEIQLLASLAMLTVSLTIDDLLLGEQLVGYGLKVSHVAVVLLTDLVLVL